LTDTVKEGCVSREDLIQIEGVVREVMAGGQFRVESEKGQQFFAKISGRMRRFHIKVIPGDRVTVAVSPYDPTHGLIVYRST
jgi:translation initiation factor IF-1